MGERPKIATADELVAKELRKALRRKARVADLVGGHEDEIRKLDQEDKALDKAIRGLRDNLTSEFDADGNPVEIDVDEEKGTTSQTSSASSRSMPDE